MYSNLKDTPSDIIRQQNPRKENQSQQCFKPIFQHFPTSLSHHWHSARSLFGPTEHVNHLKRGAQINIFVIQKYSVISLKKLDTIVFNKGSPTGANRIFVGDYFQQRINIHLVKVITAAGGCMWD